MRAMILAAGKGTRISRLINNTPKCCVDIGGTELINHSIGVLNNVGITDIALITGYGKEKVLDVLKAQNVKIYYNPFFEVTNSIASLWFARDFLRGSEETIILNGDVFFEESIIEKCLVSKDEILMLADSSKIKGADYRFNWKDSTLLKFGKDLSDDETTGEYVGLAKISSGFISNFITRLNKMIESGNYNGWWEDVIYSFIKEEYKVKILDLKGKTFWAEIDYVEDYNRIKEYFDKTVSKRPGA
ncbi:MAG: phosphocholine cytidylyltransferase family protein [Bacteroidales bacterium]|jgi:choline kinase